MRSLRLVPVRLGRAHLAPLWGALLCLLAAAPAGAQEAPTEWAARPDHVVLVSIDGLRPEFYRDPRWPAPTLQWMAREGAQAEGVRGVFPSVTYPSHTTLVTGALPARHGVLYNTPFEPAGQTGAWYWEASAIRARSPCAESCGPAPPGART